MLIECPECHNKISDQSKICVHCGFPLNNQVNTCIINGEKYDLTEELLMLTQTDYMQGLRNLRDKCNLDLSDVTTLGNIIKTTKQIPAEYNSSQNKEYREKLNAIENKNIPKCPTCGSTNIQKISGLSKAGSVAMWGIFSRKVHKQWHCNNCKSDF